MLPTGRKMDAQEAERDGQTTRVVPALKLKAVTLEAAAKICTYGSLAAALIKQLISQTFEVPLSEGVKVERRILHTVFRMSHRRKAQMFS